MSDHLKILTTIVHFLHYGTHMKWLIKIGQICKRGSPSGLNDLRGLDITNQLRISPTTTDQACLLKFHNVAHNVRTSIFRQKKIPAYTCFLSLKFSDPIIVCLFRLIQNNTYHQLGFNQAQYKLAKDITSYQPR